MAMQFSMDFGGASRRKVRTFQGELRRKTRKLHVVGLIDSGSCWVSNSAVEKARINLENFEEIQPITVSFSVLGKYGTFFFSPRAFSVSSNVTAPFSTYL